MKSLFAMTLATAILSGCATVDNRDYVANKNNNLTVAKAQSQLKKGMASAEVAEVMGSPNIVTNDQNNNETWVYDKISSEDTYAQSGVGGGFLVYAANQIKGARSTTQKTLTVIVKFDENKKVSDVKYHQSTF